MKHCQNPARISLTQDEYWPIKTILCFLFIKKPLTTWVKAHDTICKAI